MTRLEGYRGAITVIVFLVVISPLFGIVLAKRLGYTEPLDVAAEKLGLHERPVWKWSPLADYTFPGLPDTLGYIVSGLIGVALIILVGLALVRLTGFGGS